MTVSVADVFNKQHGKGNIICKIGHLAFRGMQMDYICYSVP